MPQVNLFTDVYDEDEEAERELARGREMARLLLERGLAPDEMLVCLAEWLAMEAERLDRLAFEVPMHEVLAAEYASAVGRLQALARKCRQVP